MSDRSILLLVSAMVCLNACVALTHYLGHSGLEIQMTDHQMLFINVVVLAAPVLAAMALWTRLMRPGAWALILSLGTGLGFGVYHHFLSLSPDHVANVPPSNVRWVFHVTAVLLPVLQLAGIGAALWALRRIPSSGAAGDRAG